MNFRVCLPVVAGILLADSVLAAQPEGMVNRNPAVLAASVVTAKTERIAADRLRISLTPQAGVASQFKLLDAEGKEVSATRAADGTLQAVLDPRRAYLLTPPSPARRALPLEGLPLPARYVTIRPDGGANLGGLFLRPARVPLTWNEQEKAYSTELFVGYEFQDGAERPIAPKTVTFFAEGSNARVFADTVKVERSGVAGYQRVTLVTSEFGGETHFTARAGPADELKGSVSVRREPGALKLNLPSTEIAAFGVGSGKLSVVLLARDGGPLVAEQKMEVQLSSKRLRLPAMIELKAGESVAEVEFHSASQGSDEITATSGRLVTMQAIRVIFPVAAVVAAVAGGALGGAARYLRNQRRRKNSLLARRLIEGVLVGVILVGAVWTGLVTVDVGAGVLGTPFGALVLAALSGYLGCVVLDRVAEKTFNGLKPEA